MGGPITTVGYERFVLHGWLLRAIELDRMSRRQQRLCRVPLAGKSAGTVPPSKTGISHEMRKGYEKSWKLGEMTVIPGCTRWYLPTCVNQNARVGLIWFTAKRGCHILQIHTFHYLEPLGLGLAFERAAQVVNIIDVTGCTLSKVVASFVSSDSCLCTKKLQKEHGRWFAKNLIKELRRWCRDWRSLEHVSYFRIFPFAGHAAERTSEVFLTETWVPRMLLDYVAFNIIIIVLLWTNPDYYAQCWCSTVGSWCQTWQLVIGWLCSNSQQEWCFACSWGAETSSIYAANTNTMSGFHITIVAIPRVLVMVDIFTPLPGKVFHTVMMTLPVYSLTDGMAWNADLRLHHQFFQQV